MPGTSTAPLLSAERTGEFKGRYHVLLGALSPLDGIGPDDLKAEASRRLASAKRHLADGGPELEPLGGYVDLLLRPAAA